MQSIILMIAVFISGLSSLGMEMAASRLLGNVFGTSNLVWANIIGLILIYLTAGYFIGGRWADRSPNMRTFYLILAWAAFTTGLIPMAARPVLLRAAAAVENLEVALMAGSFLAMIILFVFPVTLMGCISPFAIRLALTDTEHAGKISGRIYAISTLGSIIGTFLPTLFLIPTVGTSNTFLIFSGLLLLMAIIGLVVNDRKALLYIIWMPVVLIVLALIFLKGPIKRTTGQIFEDESAYNYIQVVERDGTRFLMLNEGQGIHSVYTPGQDLTSGTWDYFLVAPFFNSPAVDMESVESLALVGLAAGTIAKQYTNVFGAIPIDGWEIDPGIIEVGRTYFDMTEPNLNAVASDGRWGLNHSGKSYSVIGIDAYRLPYIPWHLTTQEFFMESAEHLTDNGVVVINVGRTPNDRRLINALAATMGSVFPSVHVVDVSGTFNTILYATVLPTEPENLVYNLLSLQESGANPVLIDTIELAITNLQETPADGMVFTDDVAPIEKLTNAIIIQFALNESLEILR
ncbi:MAG: fused MFS/spermidine synthase [Anaerolineales bacterium]|nr:fused MFS/spermidine synthase [Anaerolineales bacterium]